MPKKIKQCPPARARSRTARSGDKDTPTTIIATKRTPKFVFKLFGQSPINLTCLWQSSFYQCYIQVYCFILFYFMFWRDFTFCNAFSDKIFQVGWIFTFFLALSTRWLIFLTMTSLRCMTSKMITLLITKYNAIIAGFQCHIIQNRSK